MNNTNNTNNTNTNTQANTNQTQDQLHMNQIGNANLLNKSPVTISCEIRRNNW
jgi:IS30 family transposase